MECELVEFYATGAVQFHSVGRYVQPVLQCALVKLYGIGRDGRLEQVQARQFSQSLYRRLIPAVRNLGQAACQCVKTDVRVETSLQIWQFYRTVLCGMYFHVQIPF